MADDRYFAPLFRPTVGAEVPNASIIAQVVGQMYRLGAILERAEELRAVRNGGGTLTVRQARFVGKADRLLEVGIEAFAAREEEG